MTGTGTQENPYIITAPEELYSMSETGDSGSYFRLGNDIDFNGSEYAENFLTIPLKGKQLDGNGFKIRNILKTDVTNIVYLFSIANSGIEIRNLNVENVRLTGTRISLFSGNSVQVRLYNCQFSLDAQYSASPADQYSLINSINTVAINAELCTFILDIKWQTQKTILNGGTYSRCQFRINDRANAYTSTYSITRGNFLSSKISDSYFFISYGLLSNSSDKNITLFPNTHISNVYAVIKTDNISRIVFSGIADTTVFFDKDAAGDTEISIDSTSYKYNVYALTEQQCKDAGYLRSIGFLCEEVT